MDLGPRIRAWLQVRNMTQAELADACGVTPQAVTAWVKHNAPPSLKNLNAIFDALGTSVQEFYGRIPKAKKPS